MLTFEDCLALCHFTEKEIAAIAEHEHIPEIAAIEYGEYLIHTDDGEKYIKRMILEDIEEAKSCGNLEHAQDLETVLKHFVANHPKLQRLLEAKCH